MPISNLKFRNKVKEEYKHWFPLEDPTPYWEEVNKKLWDASYNRELSFFESLDLVIYAGEKAIEFNNSSPPRTPADVSPIGMFIMLIHGLDDPNLWPDYKIYWALMHMADELYYHNQLITLLLSVLKLIKSGEYIPMNSQVARKIKLRYKEYVRVYDPYLGNYHTWFGYED